MSTGASSSHKHIDQGSKWDEVQLIWSTSVQCVGYMPGVLVTLSLAFKDTFYMFSVMCYAGISSVIRRFQWISVMSDDPDAVFADKTSPQTSYFLKVCLFFVF